MHLSWHNRRLTSSNRIKPHQTKSTSSCFHVYLSASLINELKHWQDVTTFLLDLQGFGFFMLISKFCEPFSRPQFSFDLEQHQDQHPHKWSLWLCQLGPTSIRRGSVLFLIPLIVRREEMLSCGYYKKLEGMISLEEMATTMCFYLIFIIVSKFRSPTFHRFSLSWTKYVHCKR